MIDLIKKEDCVFENNYVIYQGKIVEIPYPVLHKLNELEGLYQRALFVSKQPEGQAAPSLEGFKFESVVDEAMPVAVPNTPALDAKVQETLAFLEDIDEIEFCKKLNNLIEKFKPLFKFVRSSVIKDSSGYGQEIDLKYVGNPLELTEARVMDILEFAAKQDERCELYGFEEDVRNAWKTAMEGAF